MHYKRKRPKNRRAGCLLCKPHKQNHAPRKMVEEANPRNRRERERFEKQVEEAIANADVLKLDKLADEYLEYQLSLVR